MISIIGLMIGLAMFFVFGFVFGFIFLTLATLGKVKTHDLTIIGGKVRWIDRADKMFMNYEQLKEKYKV